MAKTIDVLCAGVIVADHICTPITHLPAEGELVLAERMMLTIGGCAANVAVDLARMGLHAAAAGRVGGDVFGGILADMLREHDLETSDLRVSPLAATSQTLIVNVAGQDRRFIHTFGANAEFCAADIVLERVRSCRILYVGGYLLLPQLRQEELVPIFTAARQAGGKTVLDVAIPGAARYLDRLDQLLPHVDVFLPNDHEAGLITGETDPWRQAEHFHQLGAATVVVTQGNKGAVLVQDGLRLRAGVYPVEFVDGSGSGDAFDAGYIFGLLQGLEAEDCLRLASALGASCVRAVGTTTSVFDRAECEAFMRTHTLPIERF